MQSDANTAAIQELREQSERLQLALSASGMGTWEMNLVNGRRMWSDQTCKLHGFERSGQDRRPVELDDRLMHPEDREKLKALHDELRAGRDDYDFVYRTDTGGELRWIEARGTVLEREAGGPTRIVGVCADITQRMQAEEANRRADERLRRLADAMPQLVWIAGRDGAIAYYNGRRAEYAGAENANEWQPLIHPEDLKPTLDAWRRALTTGANYEMEHRLQRAGGQYAWHLSRATAVRASDGAIAAWYGTATDIDTLKRAETHLAQAERRLLLATEAAEMFAWEVDLVAGTMTWAPNAARILGCDESMLTADPRGAVFFVAARDRDRLAEAFSRAIAANANTCAVEFQGVENGAAQKHWRAFGSFVRNGHGDVERIAGITQDITRQRNTGEAMRIFAERLWTAEEAAGALVYDWDRVANVVWRSGGLTKMLGWRQDEVAPTPEAWDALFHPDDRRHIAELRQEDRLGPDDRYVLEYRIRHKNGHYAWLMDAGRAFRDASGAIVRQAGATIDITARKHDEEALRRMASLIELSFDPILVWNRAGGIVEWNKGAEQLYGFSRQEALGRGSHELLQAGHPIQLQELLDILDTAKSWAGELRHRTKDGRILTVESRQQLIVSDGEALVLETNRDITGRKRAEADLALMAAVASASHDALYGASLDGIIQAWNPSAERLFGYAAAEAIGRHIHMIAEPGLHQEQRDFLAWVKTGETVGPFDTRRRRKDGKIVDVSVAIAPVKAPDGSVTAVSAAFHDIGDRKEWEKRQRLMTRELAHRVKNSFAVLQAILRSTLTSSASPAEFAAAFAGRLHGLSAAQDILIDSDWKSAELGALAKHQLEFYRGDDTGRIRLDGPRVDLGAEYAAPFALLLNELATNALKHGALSVPDGRIALSWRVEPAAKGGSRLILVWQEIGGPPVEPPTRRGFGSRLIQQGIPGAAVDCAFHPDGLVCTLELPFAPVRPSRRKKPRHTPSGA